MHSPSSRRLSELAGRGGGAGTGGRRESPSSTTRSGSNSPAPSPTKAWAAAATTTTEAAGGTSGSRPGSPSKKRVYGDRYVPRALPMLHTSAFTPKPDDGFLSFPLYEDDRFIPNRDGLDLVTSFTLLPGGSGSNNTSGSSTPNSGSRGGEHKTGNVGSEPAHGAVPPPHSLSPFLPLRHIQDCLTLIRIHAGRNLQRKRTRRSIRCSAPNCSAPPRSTTSRSCALHPQLAPPNTPPSLRQVEPLPAAPPRQRTLSSISLRRVGNGSRERIRRGASAGLIVRRMSGIASVRSGMRVRGC